MTSCSVLDFFKCLDKNAPLRSTILTRKHTTRSRACSHCNMPRLVGKSMSYLCHATGRGQKNTNSKEMSSKGQKSVMSSKGAKEYQPKRIPYFFINTFSSVVLCTDALVFSLLPPPLVILLQRLVLSSPFSLLLMCVWMGGLKFVFQQNKNWSVTSR